MSGPPIQPVKPQPIQEPAFVQAEITELKPFWDSQKDHINSPIPGNQWTQTGRWEHIDCGYAPCQIEGYVIRSDLNDLFHLVFPTRRKQEVDLSDKSKPEVVARLSTEFGNITLTQKETSVQNEGLIHLVSNQFGHAHFTSDGYLDISSAPDVLVLEQRRNQRPLNEQKEGTKLTILGGEYEVEKAIPPSEKGLPATLILKRWGRENLLLTQGREMVNLTFWDPVQIEPINEVPERYRSQYREFLDLYQTLIQSLQPQNLLDNPDLIGYIRNLGKQYAADPQFEFTENDGHLRFAMSDYHHIVSLEINVWPLKVSFGAMDYSNPEKSTVDFSGSSIFLWTDEIHKDFGLNALWNWNTNELAREKYKEFDSYSKLLSAGFGEDNLFHVADQISLVNYGIELPSAINPERTFSDPESHVQYVGLKFNGVTNLNERHDTEFEFTDNLPPMYNEYTSMPSKKASKYLHASCEAGFIVTTERPMPAWAGTCADKAGPGRYRADEVYLDFENGAAYYRLEGDIKFFPADEFCMIELGGNGEKRTFIKTAKVAGAPAIVLSESAKSPNGLYDFDQQVEMAIRIIPSVNGKSLVFDQNHYYRGMGDLDFSCYQNEYRLDEQPIPSPPYPTSPALTLFTNTGGKLVAHTAKDIPRAEWVLVPNEITVNRKMSDYELEEQEKFDKMIREHENSQNGPTTQQNHETLFIYPNPVRRGRSVSASFNSEHDGSALLLIYDQSLQLIKQLPTIQISSGQPYDWTIQTSDMPLGLMEILLVIQPQAGQSFKKAKSLMITD